MPDHIHMLVSIPPELAVAEFVRKVKYASSRWLRDNKKFPLFSGWGEGYAAFTYSHDQIPIVKDYIIHQKEHHRGVAFADEYRRYIIDNGGEIDEQYFLKE